jgi:hypothetical protein
MRSPAPVVISGAVEGLVDEAMIRRLVEHLEASAGSIHGKKGKGYLREKIGGYNNAAVFSPWVVLVDLNQDAECAPILREKWLPSPSPYMCFRIPVREVESWIFADRERLARFLSVAVSSIPTNPEAVDKPKLAMIDLARHSRRREIREDMVPRPGSRRKIGPAYNSRMIEFIEDTSNGWRPDVAVRSSDSLERCLRCLSRIVQKFRYNQHTR